MLYLLLQLPYITHQFNYKMNHADIGAYPTTTPTASCVQRAFNNRSFPACKGRDVAHRSLLSDGPRQILFVWIKEEGGVCTTTRTGKPQHGLLPVVWRLYGQRAGSTLWSGRRPARVIQLGSRPWIILRARRGPRVHEAAGR